MHFLFVVGFISILGQVVLLRELNVAFYGVELIYTLALGIWLLSTACGAVISRKSEDPAFSHIKILLLLLSVAIPLDVAFIRSSRMFVSSVPGAYLPLHTQIGIMFASLLPIGILLGLLFQWTAKAYISSPKSLADAYAIESLGGLAGGIGATLFLKFGFQNFFIALLCALVAAGACFLKLSREEGRWIHLTAVLIMAALLLLVWQSDGADRRMTSWSHPDLVETRDTPYSRISVTFLNGQASVFENNALLFDTESTRSEEFVNLAALQHPAPKTILVLGGGIEGTIREALSHSPQRVDYVELNPALVDIVPRHLPPDIQRSLHARNVRILYDDPRRFLDKSSNYDLILIGMPEPASGQANRFYTREFFRQCYIRLNENGIVAFSLQSAENFWTPQLTRKMVSIYRAVKSVFPDVLFLPGSNNIVLASRRQLARDPSTSAVRLAERKIPTRLVSESYLRYLYTNDRFHQIEQTLKSENAPMNTDGRPICYRYALTVWLSRFYPSSKLPDLSFPEMSSSRYLICAVLLVILMRAIRKARWQVRRVLLAGSAGFIGMVLETILILHFQTKNGILFQDIGVLLTGFMSGLAVGALAVARSKHPGSWGMGAAVTSGFAALSVLVGILIASGRGAGLLQIFVLLALTGFLVAALFAFAGLRFGGNQKQIIGTLYAADLLGGCMASILASLALAPLAGLELTAFWTSPLALLALLLI
jgi:spermidine synthase